MAPKTRSVEVKEGNLIEVVLPDQQVGKDQVGAILVIDPSKLGYLTERAVQRKGQTSLCGGAFILRASKK